MYQVPIISFIGGTKRHKTGFVAINLQSGMLPEKHVGQINQ
jgi:hypothetical protein